MFPSPKIPPQLLSPSHLMQQSPFWCYRMVDGVVVDKIELYKNRNSARITAYLFFVHFNTLSPHLYSTNFIVLMSYLSWRLCSNIITIVCAWWGNNLLTWSAMRCLLRNQNLFCSTWLGHTLSSASLTMIAITKVTAHSLDSKGMLPNTQLTGHIITTFCLQSILNTFTVH